MELADKVKKLLKFPSKPSKIDVVGSIGRGEPNYKDIDLLITVPTVTKDYLSNVTVKKPYKITNVRSCGTYNCYFTVEGFPEINLFLTNKEDYIYALLSRLKSKGQNIGLKRHAKRKGMKLSQYGLYKGSDRVNKKFKNIEDLENYLKS